MLHKIALELLGTPFKDKGRDPKEGLDCWGFLMEIGKRTNTPIPEYYVSCFDVDTVKETYQQNEKKHFFLEKPEIGCVVAMQCSTKYPSAVNHFGLYLGKNTFIHAVEGYGVITTKLNDPLYKNKIKGFYRWIQ